MCDSDEKVRKALQNADAVLKAIKTGKLKSPKLVHQGGRSFSVWEPVGWAMGSDVTGNDDAASNTASSRE